MYIQTPNHIKWRVVREEFMKVVNIEWS